jgi:hypothetical protein
MWASDEMGKLTSTLELAMSTRQRSVAEPSRMKCKLLSERGDVGSQGLESCRPKFARDRKSSSRFECLNGLAGAGAKHTIGFEVSVP